MQIRDESKTDVKPSLSPMCSLYFDNQHQRWVIRAPNQVVFPDSESLEVLLLCDGTKTVAEISGTLRQKDADFYKKAKDSVGEIVSRFIRRGVLETPSD